MRAPIRGRTTTPSYRGPEWYWNEIVRDGRVAGAADGYARLKPQRLPCLVPGTLTVAYFPTIVGLSSGSGGLLILALLA